LPKTRATDERVIAEKSCQCVTAVVTLNQIVEAAADMRAFDAGFST
jgi:hypothetical protein